MIIIIIMMRMRMRYSVLLLLLLLCGSEVVKIHVNCQLSPSEKIKHIVLLMMENRSYDHYFGHNPNANWDGLTGNECNFNTRDNVTVCVNDRVGYRVPVDPGHGTPAVGIQVYGSWPTPTPYPEPAPMNGFADQYIEINGNPDDVMGGFSPDRVPIMTALAEEFAQFDAWFCSTPGPTAPNRFFVHSATSDGSAEWDIPKLIYGYRQKSIYQSLQEEGYTWKNYFQLVPSLLLFDWHRREDARGNYHFFDQFLADSANGTLPFLSFIDVRYLDFPEVPQNDQHPSASHVLEGEKTIKQIYESLRSSPTWENTLLLITYDEHGGWYDHVSPPTAASHNVPNPDGKYGEDVDPPFPFDRLGPRVPTVAISPWIPRGTVVKAPPAGAGQYEHSSFPATIKRMYNLTSDYLTERDRWAASFEHIFSLNSPRTDTPVLLPEIPPYEPKKNAHLDLTTELQQEFVQLASVINGVEFDFVTGEGMTEYEAGLYIEEQVRIFLSKTDTGKALKPAAIN